MSSCKISESTYDKSMRVNASNDEFRSDDEFKIDVKCTKG